MCTYLMLSEIKRSQNSHEIERQMPLKKSGIQQDSSTHGAMSVNDVPQITKISRAGVKGEDCDLSRDGDRVAIKAHINKGA